jgi:Kef-type K+ transport system membrane component KefB
VNLPELAVSALLAAGFTVVVAKWGSWTVARVAPRVEEKLHLGEAQFALSIGLLFGLSVLAVYVGVAAIVGAFLAGMALSESVGSRVRDLSRGVTELLVPFFLVGIGLHLDPAALAQPSTLLLAVVILAAAVLSKFLGCGLGALSLGVADAMRVGVGMIPRGEVGMVVAQIGLGLGVISQHVYGVVVFMAAATTLLAPPLLAWAYRNLKGAKEEEVFRIG